MTHLGTALQWLLTLSLSGVAGVAIAAPDAVKVAEQPSVWREPHTGLVFVALPQGCFQMGTGFTTIDSLSNKFKVFANQLVADEMPQHQVCLDPFWIGQTEVRASDWVQVMGKPAPSGSGPEPAGGISFEAAKQFAERLTQLSGGESLYRLPTEAEWEYACRAEEVEETLPLYESRADVAWYSVKGYRITQPTTVGQLKANGWGLHDMLGNVWEWTEDGYQADGYHRHSLYNPLLSESPSGERVIRGASHRSDYIQLRCGNRSSYPATEALGQIGLRLVRQSLVPLP